MRRSVEDTQSFMTMGSADAVDHVIYRFVYRKRAILTVRLCQDQFSYNNQREMLIQNK